MKVVLVVDDSTTMRRMILTSLKELEGVRFEEVTSGMEAVERLVLGPVDLIILDLNMPDMHGMDVLRFLRQHASLRCSKVLVLTTRGDESSRTEARECGAAAYMTKPFEPAELALCARELLEQTNG
ncbi:MAG: response regulator [Syntrophobacteraceae bacterium]